MTDGTLPGLDDLTPPAGPFIEEMLQQALISEAQMHLPPLGATDECATNAEVAAVYAPWNRDLHAFLWGASLAHVLIRLEETHPNLAAGLAHEVKEFLDAGDAYPEWIWEWATGRGMDPEKIRAEAREKHAEWLAAPPKRRAKRRPSATPTSE